MSSKIENLISSRNVNNNRTIFYSKLLRDYLNSPLDAAKYMSSTKTTPNGIDTSEISKDFEEILEGLLGTYTMAYATELGKKRIVREIQTCVDTNKVLEQEFNNRLDDMLRTLRDNKNTVLDNMDLTVILSKINASSGSKMLQEYFTNNMLNTIKLNMMDKVDMDPVDYINKLGNVLPKMVKDMNHDLDTTIKSYVDRTEFITAKYNLVEQDKTLAKDVEINVKVDDVELYTSVDVRDIIIKYLHEVEGSRNTVIQNAVQNVVFKLDEVKVKIAELYNDLEAKLTKLKEADFTLYNRIFNTFFVNAITKFEHRSMVDELYVKYLETYSKFLNITMASDNAMLISLYNKFIGINILYRAYYAIYSVLFKLVSNTGRL